MKTNVTDVLKAHTVWASYLRLGSQILSLRVTARFILREITKELDHRTVSLDISFQSCMQYVFIHLFIHICIQNMFLSTCYVQVNAIHNEGTIKKQNKHSFLPCSSSSFSSCLPLSHWAYREVSYTDLKQRQIIK